LSAQLNFTNEELVEVMLAALIGTKDNVIDAKRVMAQMKAKELNLTFERAGRQPNGIEPALAA
jgi:DNA repair protein RadC